jgi:hypothetical protein
MFVPIPIQMDKDMHRFDKDMHRFDKDIHRFASTLLIFRTVVIITPLSEGGGGILGLTSPHVCAYSNPEPAFSTSYVVVSFYFFFGE